MIEVKHLTKKYASATAVNDVSFTVEPGKIYGFLGPNGAGKSTTMNIIAGCLAPTDGQVLINGYDITEEPEEAKRFIGYLPEIPPLYPDFTPLEYLTFVGKAKGLRGAELRSQLDYVIEAACIGEMKNRLIKNLSKGYKQRVGIAQAMLGNPEIIILDEPTVGLDPRQIIYIRSLIKKLGENHTVILSSHILSEISAICDYVIILSYGKVVASDTLENLSNSLENGRITNMTVRAEPETIKNVLSSVERITEYEIIETKESGVWDIKITAEADADIKDGLFSAFAKLGAPVYKLAPETMSLEEMFLRLTNDVTTEDIEDELPDDPEDSYYEEEEEDIEDKEDEEDEEYEEYEENSVSETVVSGTLSPDSPPPVNLSDGQSSGSMTSGEQVSGDSEYGDSESGDEKSHM